MNNGNDNPGNSEQISYAVQDRAELQPTPPSICKFIEQNKADQNVLDKKFKSKDEVIENSEASQQSSSASDTKHDQWFTNVFDLDSFFLFGSQIL